jgi:hypothetical protein
MMSNHGATLPAELDRTFDLEHLTAADASALAKAVSLTVRSAPSRQAAAQRLVELLFRSLLMPGTAESACVLARCFQTSTYAQLPLHYRDAADHLLDDDALRPAALEHMRCLTLLATRGVRPVWNDVLTSVAHQAIPLPSAEVVRKAPMIARLFDQLGVSIERAVAPPDSPDFLLDAPSDFRVFHIADAPGSPFLPAQTSFVLPFGVRSVVGMGGVLPDGEVLAVILFTRLPVSQEVARCFTEVAANLRAALMNFGSGPIFQATDDWRRTEAT